MDIYFLRHASAGEPKMNPAKDDERELDEQGIEQSHIVGRALAVLEVQPDVILSSPLIRARQTAEIVADEMGNKSEIVVNEALQPHGTYKQFETLLARYKNSDAILVAGHNPSLTKFLSEMVAEKPSEALELKKGAIAKVEREDGNPAVLKWMMPPKVARALQQASAKSLRPKTSSK